MRTDVALRRFDDHQQGILDHVAAAVRLIEGDPATVRTPLAVARWGLARRLREYQLFKHHEIFNPAIRNGTSLHARRATMLLDHCLVLGRRYQDYLQRWSGQDIVAVWADYKPAMLTMTADLRRALAEERAQVKVLLAGSERTRHLHL